eukprot:scaffold88_cov387-Prasinococcus_capsulatus_cf.AAC.7
MGKGLEVGDHQDGRGAVARTLREAFQRIAREIRGRVTGPSARRAEFTLRHAHSPTPSAHFRRREREMARRLRWRRGYGPGQVPRPLRWRRGARWTAGDGASAAVYKGRGGRRRRCSHEADRRSSTLSTCFSNQSNGP